MPYRSERDNPRNPYYPRHESKEKEWYKKPLNIVIIIGILILIIIIASNIGGRSSTDLEGNQTKELTEQETLIRYIIAQQNAGVNQKDITEKLIIAGFSQKEIDFAFKVADPLVQYIIKELEDGKSKTEIIDVLLSQGMDPLTIKNAMDTAEEYQLGGFSKFMKNNWIILVLGVIVIYITFKEKGDTLSKKAPKVFTLEEAKIKAEGILKEKGLDFSPTHRYKNRPEVRSYRFIYEEPMYPEFNNPQPWGYQAGQKRFYLLSIGYDCELTDFHITFRDTLPREYLDGPVSPSEKRGSAEYSKLRENSERPIEDIKKREYKFNEDYNYLRNTPYNVRRRTSYRSRIRPSPIGGYEGYEE